MSKKRKGLGRGLDALLDVKSTLSGLEPVSNADKPVDEAASNGGTILQIPIERIQRGQFQPRTHFDQTELEELAGTIKSVGLMQPIIVRKLKPSTAAIDYEIIAGERRWRACQIAGLDEVSATVTTLGDDQVAAMALIENIQREDLNPIEEARAYQRLQQEFELNQEEVAEFVGKSRPTIANLLRLLTLDDDVILLLEHGDIDMGHARALISLKASQQRELARQVASKSLSVRQTEALVKQKMKGDPVAKKNSIDKDTQRLQNKLSETLGSKVAIVHQSSGKGKIIINYNSLDELDGLLKHIK